MPRAATGPRSPATSSPSARPSTKKRPGLAGFDDKWGKRYPSIAGTWERAWSEFVPFPGLPDAIRQVVYSTNAIESLSARYRRAARACGRFPSERAALKRLYLAALALDPTGRGRQRWHNRGKSALNESDVLFDGRLTAGRVQAGQPIEKPVRQLDGSHLDPDARFASRHLEDLMPAVLVSGFVVPDAAPPGPAVSAGWRKLGFERNPVPGDPQVLREIVGDFTYLRDTAWSVSQGLNTVVASAADGEFEGTTADALRDVISGRLKTFVFTVARAFSLAGEAVAGYRLALVEAQRTVGEVVSRAGGLAAEDPGLEGLWNQVCEQVARVRGAGALMIRALEDAAYMVSQPVKVPSVFERIWKGVETALGVAGTVLALVSTVVDGPLGIMAAGAEGASFAMALTDYIRGDTGVTGLVSGAVGLLLPATKGVFTLEEAGAGLRAFVGTLGPAGGKAAGVLSSPAVPAAFLVRSGQRSWQALTGVPGLLVDRVRAVPGIIGGIPHALNGLPDAVIRDFATVRKWYPRLSFLSPCGAYALVNLGRFTGALFTPMTVGDIAALGFRGAWRAGWERALWTSAARALRAGWSSYGLRAARPVQAQAKAVLKNGVLGVIVLDTVEQDGAHGLLNTRSALLMPAAGVLGGQGGQLLHQPGRHSAEMILNDSLTIEAGSERFTVPVDATPPAALPRRDTRVPTAGRQTAAGAPPGPTQVAARREHVAFRLADRPVGGGLAGRAHGPQDVRDVAGWAGDARQALDLLHGRTPGAAPLGCDPRTANPLSAPHLKVPSPPGVKGGQEAMYGTRGPQARQAPERPLRAFGDGTEPGPEALGRLTQPELHTTAGVLRASRSGPAVPDSRTGRLGAVGFALQGKAVGTVRLFGAAGQSVALRDTLPAARLGPVAGRLSGGYGRVDHAGGSAVRIVGTGPGIGSRSGLESAIGLPSARTTGEASARKAEAASPSVRHVGPEADLEHEYGPLTAPTYVKEKEKGSDGRIKLNPLRYRLSDFNPALLERTGGCWLYTVNARGDILIGSESVVNILTEQERRSLIESMRQVTPGVSDEALREVVDGQGHPTIAAGFDGSGQITAGSMARVSGELWWNQDTARWEVNDKSGRYMNPRFRHDINLADLRRWVANVAERMSARFGIAITPGLLKYEQLLDAALPAEPSIFPRRTVWANEVWQAAIDKSADKGLVWHREISTLLDAYGRGLIDLVPANRPERRATDKPHHFNPDPDAWERANTRRKNGGAKLMSMNVLCAWLATDYLRDALSATFEIGDTGSSFLTPTAHAPR